ncbi:MAG: right-handed parallel beta-helix repeat-containing protein [Bacteroidia bacterium]
MLCLPQLDHTEITRCIFEGNSKAGSTQKTTLQGPALIHAKHGNIYSVIIRDNIFRNTSGKTWGIRLSGDVKYAEVVNNRFENLPGTALVVYAEKALILGNSFRDGTGRDIQMLSGTGHQVYCNTFAGNDRSLVYNESSDVYMLGNRFNQDEVIPARQMEQKKPVLTELPLPRVMARGNLGQPAASSKTTTGSVLKRQFR